MPTNSVAFNGVVANSTFSLDLKNHPVSRDKFGGQSAAEILEQADKILESTSILLKNHKDFIPADEFKELHMTYCSYHWHVTNEAQEDRANTDKIIRQSHILSQLYANKQSRVKRARHLLYKAEAYQTRVLAASRNAQRSDPLELSQDAISDASEEMSQPTPADENPPPYQSHTWFFPWPWGGRNCSSTGLSTDLDSGSGGSEDSAPSYVVEGEGFVVSVTHLPICPPDSADADTILENPSAVGGGRKMYRRKIVLENSEKRVEIIDPKLYSLDSNETRAEMKTLQGMLKLGETIMRQKHTEVVPGSFVITSSQSGPSLEAIIRKARKLSAVVPE